MKRSGTGRILLWRGGSLWIGRVGEQTGSHFHHAVQISLALGAGPLRFRMPGEDWKTYRAALIPTHQPHAFDAPGETVVHLFAEPESREGRMLHLEHRRRGIRRLDADERAARFAGVLRARYEAQVPDESLRETGGALIAALAGAMDSAQRLDPRVARAIEAVRERLGDAVRLSDAAGTVHLSPERFRRLFLEETGMRFRPYVLWLRLERALEAYSAGRTLTEAAQAGGFADSAHLSRTFRRMFGVAPASLEIE